MQFSEKKYIPISFAAWDGENKERGTQKSVSSRYYLYLEGKQDYTSYIVPIVAVVISIIVEIVILKKVKK